MTCLTKTQARILNRIVLHGGGFQCNIHTIGLHRLPIFALWENSAPLTDEEATQLANIVDDVIKRQYPDADEQGRAPAANMITVKKTETGWQFRRMTWQHGPPFIPVEPVPLSELGVREDGERRF